MGDIPHAGEKERCARTLGLTKELDQLLGLVGAPKEKCPYKIPPSVDVQSETAWTINGVPREQADQSLCQMIIVNQNACTGCPMNVKPPEPSAFLQLVLEVDELMEAGANIEPDYIELKARGILRRKRNEKQIKDMEARKPRA